VTYKVETYRAIDKPGLNKIFIREHANVLKDYGVTMITSFKHSWLENPYVHCIVAYDEAGIMVGGIRVQIKDWTKYPLPMEDAIAKLDEGIFDLVKKYKAEGVGELCGLWNAKSVQGVGISYVLTRAAVSIINQLKFDILMGICAEYSLPMFKSVGFEIDTSLSNNGEFPYPTDKYITRVVGILKSSTLETAAEYDRAKIFGLRKKPVQIRGEEGKKGKFKVDYNLIVNVLEQ
jgi:hypothetical protein